MKNFWVLGLLVSVLFAAMATLADGQDGNGFKPIFDGKTLDGWKAADMSYWSIEDDAITGKITPEHPLKNNLYLIWKGGDLADFELKMKSRVTNPAKNTNSGFQFRSKELPNHDVAGYQMDNQQGSGFLVRLYDEHGRHNLALRGERTVFDENGKVTKEKIEEASGPADFTLEEWHEYNLVCVGRKLTLKVNGKLMAETTDNDPKNLDLQGILGLQLHSGGPTKVQFKDIQLKIIKAASDAGGGGPRSVVAVTDIGRDGARPSVLKDKTLVVWAAPANLTQKGGSALTIDDDMSHFDGIVFGEIAAGKWMAGSDFYRRTHREQKDWPAETADAKTFVQVAIVYRGTEVTIYRNGKEYSRYQIKEPQVFGEDSEVVIGLRHFGAGDGARFAGAIDDARIYNLALTADQIAALKPNEPSDPKPWAWWSFDDKEAKDRTGRFKNTEITDGARVEDGKLLLDGKNGTMICKRESETPLAVVTPTRPENPPVNWLTYHLTHPGPGNAMPGDPNCAFFWKGRYHLHYIYNHKGFVFAHISSTDLVHWTWHPTTLTPKTTGHGMFSGTGFFTKEGKPAIIYHGQGSGRNQIAVAEDDQLETWSKPWKLEPKIRPDQDGSKIANWDPDAWLDGDNYYALSGGSPGSGKPPTLFKSPDLKNWDYLGLFLAHDMPDVQKSEDISCPNFFKIGNMDMLLCISHNLGCRYYLGKWKDEKFTPDFHARMSWNGNNYFAPESVLTKDGRRVMWAWVMGLPIAPTGVQSLPRELELPDDGILRIRPLRELEMLRHDPKQEQGVTVKSDSAHKIEGASGDALELEVTFKVPTAKELGINVLCDENGENGLRIAYVAESRTLKVGKVNAPFALKEGEDLCLRVFVDKNLIEVFANDRQAAVVAQNYVAENVGACLFSKGGDVLAKEVKSWKIRSIYAGR